MQRPRRFSPTGPFCEKGQASSTSDADIGFKANRRPTEAPSKRIPYGPSAQSSAHLPTPRGHVRREPWLGTPVGLRIALVAGLWLYFVGARQLGRTVEKDEAEAARLAEEGEAIQRAKAFDWRRRLLSIRLPRLGESRNQSDGSGDAHLGDVTLYGAVDRPFKLKPALISLAVFALVIDSAALNWAPIAASAFAGAVTLILLRVITPDEAFASLRP